MSGDTASSVSKGVFVFKGTKKRAHAEDYFAIGDSGVDLTRKKILDTSWLTIGEEIQRMQTEVNVELFDNLIDYVKTAHKRLNEAQPILEIPTAALITGVNVSDHGALFTSLVRCVFKRTTRHVAVLRSKDCPTIRAAVSKTLTQLVGQDDKLELSNIENSDEDDQQLNLNKMSCTFDTLAAWYEFASQSPPEPERPVTPQKRPVSPLTIIETSPSKRQREDSPRRQLLSPRLRSAPTFSSSESSMAATSGASKSPRKQVGSPRKQVGSPRKAVGSPRKAVASPRKAVGSPRKALKSPTKAAASPRKQAGSPRKKVGSPSKENFPMNQMLSPRTPLATPRKHQVGTPIKPVRTPLKSDKTPSKEEDSEYPCQPNPYDRQAMRTPLPPLPRDKWTPIVIVLEDLEGFSPGVLQDYVTICSNHLYHLPLVLVFGIATAVTTVHRLLPSGVSSLMCIEKFQTPPSSDYLTRVVQKVVMTSQVPFKLGDKVFTLLLDLFLFHDFSVLNFINGLQLAMTLHFYNSSVSVLCQPLNFAVRAINNMTKKQMKKVMEIPSVASQIEGKSDKERKEIHNNLDYTKSLMCELLVSLDRYHRCFFPLLRCLHACTATLPRYPLGKQLRELYATCLSTDVCETDEYAEAVTLLRTFSRDELLSRLEKCSGYLASRPLPKEDFKDIREQIATFISKLNNVEALSQLAHPAEEEEEEEDLNLEAPKEKKLRLHDLKQKLQAMEKKKKKLTVYEALRTEAIDMLDNMFRKYMRCPSHQPMHEVYYYNDATELRQCLSASPRATMQRGLVDPYAYIKHPSLRSDGDYISPSQPDVSIVYKLHLECGRLINLYDWMQAFAMIVQSADDDSSDVKIDKVIQARFIRAVSELQFLGFIKPTKRKTDHVARLTF